MSPADIYPPGFFYITRIRTNFIELHELEKINSCNSIKLVGITCRIIGYKLDISIKFYHLAAYHFTA